MEVDRLSDLPELLLLHIISFLPTKFCIRTSALSRRFHHLWTASPSIDLDRSDFLHNRHFIDMSNRYFRLRDPSAPILRLSIKTYRYLLPRKSLSKWLMRAQSMGLRHLSLHIHQETFESNFPLILSFDSLESIFVDNLGSPQSKPDTTRIIVPTKFNLINLKSIHLRAHLTSSELTRLVKEQRNLEYLCFDGRGFRMSIFDLSSPSVKILKQNYLEIGYLREVTLSFPSLEILDLRIVFGKSVHFHGEMPLLRKASIKIDSQGGCFKVVQDLLRSIVNVEELDLHIKAHQSVEYLIIQPFHPLVDPEKENDFPTFHNLKRLKVSMSFHEFSIEDLVHFLHSAPVLESLELVHERHILEWQPSINISGPWMSKLPRNSEGNNEHAYFVGLHRDDKKIELVRKLSCNA